MYEKATMKEWTISGKGQKARADNTRFLPFSPVKGTFQWFTDNLHLCTLKTKTFSNFSCFFICRINWFQKLKITTECFTTAKLSDGSYWNILSMHLNLGFVPSAYPVAKVCGSMSNCAQQSTEISPLSKKFLFVHVLEQLY